MKLRAVWLLLAIVTFTSMLTFALRALPEELPTETTAELSGESADDPLDSAETPPQEETPSETESEPTTEDAPDESDSVDEEASLAEKKSTPLTQSRAPSPGHPPTWFSHDKSMQVITKEGTFMWAQDVTSSKAHTTTAGRVVVANAKKFTSYVTLFKSPGGRCYSVVLPVELPNIKVGQTMPILPGYKHDRPFIPALSGFKDVLHGRGCRRWNKMNEVAVLFPVFRSAKNAKAQFPLWHHKGSKTLISQNEQKPELQKIDAYTDMYKVPGLLQLSFEGKAHLKMTVLTHGKPTNISAKRTIFRDDEGACVIAEGDISKLIPGLMYSGAPLMHKINRDFATVHRDLRGDDWIEPFACRNIARVPVVAAVYGYGS